MKPASIGSVHHFQPHQIVCLEYENTRLYAEVIQVVTARCLCWVRPLMMTLLQNEGVHPIWPHPPLSLSHAEPMGEKGMPVPEQLVLYDLRQSADLVWPINLFRPALDTEVIPLLVQLAPPDADIKDDPAVNKQFSCFVRQVWQAYKSEFESTPAKSEIMA